MNAFGNIVYVRHIVIHVGLWNGLFGRERDSKLFSLRYTVRRRSGVRLHISPGQCDLVLMPDIKQEIYVVSKTVAVQTGSHITYHYNSPVED